MTNTELLRTVIRASGYRLDYLAGKLNLTYQGFKQKIDNVTEFKASEISILCNVLAIRDPALKEAIFFYAGVDK
jgi:hypothetical protein